jgi:hypothetical protein
VLDAVRNIQHQELASPTRAKPPLPLSPKPPKNKKKLPTTAGTVAVTTDAAADAADH